MWDDFIADITSTRLTSLAAVFRLCVALLLGAMVGIERKRKGQMAGLRTFALISTGAALAMILSIYVPQEYLGLKNGDPGRIAAQVITGIGFLGAGAIIQMKGSVRGLTTAAGIWIVATIGMAVGVGMYAVACTATALVIIVLTVLERLEYKVNVGNEARTIRIKTNGVFTDIEPLRKVLERHHIHLSRYYIDYEFDQNYTRINLLCLGPEHTDYVKVFIDLKAVPDIMSLQLSNQADIN